MYFCYKLANVANYVFFASSSSMRHLMGFHSLMNLASFQFLFLADIDYYFSYLDCNKVLDIILALQVGAVLRLPECHYPLYLQTREAHHCYGCRNHHQQHLSQSPSVLTERFFNTTMDLSFFISTIAFHIDHHCMAKISLAFSLEVGLIWELGNNLIFVLFFLFGESNHDRHTHFPQSGRYLHHQQI